MADVVLTQNGTDFLIKELQKYYNNFGSMNKNDFEVLLFHALMQSGNTEKRNFEISRMLKIPETKVKRLRYETDLKYGPTSEADYYKEKIQQLNKRLTEASIKNKGKLIEFVVEDVSLRQFLDNILKKNNRFSDSSFNSEIVRIDIKDFEILLRESDVNNEMCEQLVEEAKELIKKRVDFADLITKLVSLAADTTSIITNVSLPGLIKLLRIEAIGKALVEYFKDYHK